MGKYAREHDVGHVMLLGDNFYGSGIHGDTSNCRFQKTFEARLICLCSVTDSMMIRRCCPQDIYNATSLKDTPFYAIAGNHDHGGNVSAQIAYSGVQSRWKCKCSCSPL